MNVLLIDMDKKIPNHALMKISKWHKLRGDNVGFDIDNPNKVYISSVFTKNREQAIGIKKMMGDVEVVLGGPGLNYNNLPSEIEACAPDYDLYPSEYSQGFTTRGCVRRCDWCIVHDKEGPFRRDKSVEEFHDDRFDIVMIMDSNWLADKEWFMYNTDYIINNKLKVIEHGMDIRLLTPEIAQRLSEMKFAKRWMKFAYDQPSDRENVIKGLEMLEENGVNIRQRVAIYVLVGYNTTFEEDLERCNELKDLGTNAYVMRYSNDDKRNKLARWANWRPFYWGMTFDEYLKMLNKEVVI